MGKNDIVYLMAMDLRDLCDLTLIDTGIYAGNKDKLYVEDYSHSSKRPVRWINEKIISELVGKDQPDFIIVNSGGMSLMPETIKFLKKKKIVTIGISLSDPDVFFENGRIYSEYYDLFYTNSQYALNNLYSKQVNIKLLPFAASPRLYRPLNDVDKIYDVVVVGHARPKRIKTIKKLKKHFEVGLYGNGWGDEHNSVHGEEHVKAINSGKTYLSFSETAAGYMNVKVGLFEAIACKSCVITQMFDEMELYFKYGLDILGYKNENILVDLISNYLENEKMRNWISQNSFKKFINEHTWNKRWIKVLKDIQNFKYAL